jgi:peptidase S41-like protein
MASVGHRSDLRAAQAGRLLADFIEDRELVVREDRAPVVRRGAAQPRPAFPVESRRPLDGGERLRILDVLTPVLGGVYCHLPQKRSAYATDPVQALRLLRGRAAEMSENEFHLMVTSIVTALRDAHTRYTQTRYGGPRRSQGSVAALPFLVEQFGPYDDPTFIVSKVVDPDGIGDDEFVRGVKLESWNGIPFARAVDLYADRETGGRPDARRARALESLTFRALEYGPPPDEMWVIVGYRRPDGSRRREVKIPWRVVTPEHAPERTRPGARASRFVASDRSAELVRRAKKLLFSGPLWEAERQGRQPVVRSDKWIPTTMQDALAARVVPTSLGGLGYLRLWTFDVVDDDAYVDEIERLLGELPRKGLIVDLRGNPGGLIWAAERALQLFTDRRITPARFSLLASDMTRAMAASPFNRLELEPWLPSLETAITTGEPYSQPLPLTDPEWCNDKGRRYAGPVVCVVDANTYSAGDLFAAGFVDNWIGPLVCVGEASGGGGANVWTHYDVREALAETAYALPALPDGIGYSIAIRRAIRSGESDGVPIEDLGIEGLPYAMTKDDLLYDNRDLVEFCARHLTDD